MSGVILVHYRGGCLQQRLPEIPTADIPQGYADERFDVPNLGHEKLAPLDGRMPGEAFAIPPSIMVSLRGPRPVIRAWAAGAWNAWPVAEIAVPLTDDEVRRYVDHVRAEAFGVSRSEEQATIAAAQARARAAGAAGLARLLVVRRWIPRREHQRPRGARAAIRRPPIRAVGGGGGHRVTRLLTVAPSGLGRAESAPGGLGRAESATGGLYRSESSTGARGSP